ncbi:hypothetical protein D3C86_1097400 [compost metagenome]
MVVFPDPVGVQRTKLSLAASRSMPALCAGHTKARRLTKAARANCVSAAWVREFKSSVSRSMWGQRLASMKRWAAPAQSRASR